MFGLETPDNFPIEPVIHMARHRLGMGQTRDEVILALVEHFPHLGKRNAYLAVVAAELMEQGQVTFKCPCCAADIGTGNPSHRGIMLNAVASLGSEIVQTRDHIAQLKSKQFKGQREQDLKLLAELEAKLPAMEGRFAGMRFREKKLYYG